MASQAIRYLYRLMCVLAFASALSVTDAAAEGLPIQLSDQLPGQLARIMAHVQVLSGDIGLRGANTAGARRAAGYIDRQLSAMGATVQRHTVGTVDLPAVSVGPLRFFGPTRRTFADDNLWVELVPPAGQENEQPRPALLVMAHYDTVYGSPGAADNAVAVGIALELVRSLLKRTPARPVIVAFTAAEEHRLAGAHALARTLKRDIGLAVSLDLLGGPGELTINGASSLLGSDWLRYLARVADRAEVDIAAPVPHRVVSRHLPQIERSDHGVFTRAGTPAMHLFTRAQGAVYLPYHTHLDSLAQISGPAVLDAARMVEALARTQGAFPPSGGDQGIWLPGTRYTIPAWLMWFVCLVLVAVIFHALAMLGLTRSGERGLGLTSVLALYAASWLLVGLLCYAHRVRVDHPMPWVHSPGYLVVMTALLGLCCFAALLVLCARWRRPVGENRYLMAALFCYLLVGAGLLIVNTPELACLPLLSAGLISLLRVVRRAPVVLAIYLLSALPLLWPLSPDFLREAVYNGFFRREIPVAGFLAVLLAPASLTGFYVARRLAAVVRDRVALGILAVCCLAAALAVYLHEPTCSGALFDAYNLTCELPGIARQ